MNSNKIEQISADRCVISPAQTIYSYIFDFFQTNNPGKAKPLTKKDTKVDKKTTNNNKSNNNSNKTAKAAKSQPEPAAKDKKVEETQDDNKENKVPFHLDLAVDIRNVARLCMLLVCDVVQCLLNIVTHNFNWYLIHPLKLLHKGGIFILNTEEIIFVTEIVNLKFYERTMHALFHTFKRDGVMYYFHFATSDGST